MRVIGSPYEEKPANKGVIVIIIYSASPHPCVSSLFMIAAPFAVDRSRFVISSVTNRKNLASLKNVHDTSICQAITTLHRHRIDHRPSVIDHRTGIASHRIDYAPAPARHGWQAGTGMASGQASVSSGCFKRALRHGKARLGWQAGD